MNSKLTILGTGTFFVDKNRSASAYLLEIDNKKILIDCGSGTLIRLSQIGVKPQDIDFVFITHFHADHTSDLFPLFMNLRLTDFLGTNISLKFPQIIGPKGIYKFILNCSKNYELLSLKNWDKVKFKDIKKEQKISRGITVKAFKVNHIAFGLAANAYAYRFTYKGEVITFSGDSTKCNGIEKACKNADIFVCDASYSKGNGNLAHMDTYDIGEIAQRNKVKKVILSHLYPQTDNVDIVNEVKEKFSNEVIKARDLMVFG